MLLWQGIFNKCKLSVYYSLKLLNFLLCKINYMFPDFHFKFTHKYRISSDKRTGVYLMPKLYRTALIRGRHLKEGDAYLKKDDLVI